MVEKDAPEKRWEEDFFGEDYQTSFGRWDDALRQKTAEQLCALTGVLSGTVFDQCCGGGDLSLGFLRKNFSVFGVDQSGYMIDCAKSLCRDYEEKSFFFRDNAENFTLHDPVDLSINWHTSLGYGGEKSAHNMLDSLEKSTKNKGKIVVDVRHLENYQRSPSVSETPIRWKDRAALLLRENTWSGQTLLQNWRVLDGQETLFSKNTSCYHISRDELSAWASEKNRRVRFLADTKANKVTWHSPRVLAIFER